MFLKWAFAQVMILYKHYFSQTALTIKVLLEDTTNKYRGYFSSVYPFI